MDLEVISKLGDADGSRPPIVLIHGAWHGAWCWEDNFLGWLSDHGWDVHALSLRGHGNSEGASGLRWASISNYVSDVEQVVSNLDRLPIVIGHSMGGFVVQKFLEKDAMAGAVLLASAPTSGTLKFHQRIITRHPFIWFWSNLTMSLYPIVGRPEFAREWFFSSSIDQHALLAHVEKLQNESYRAALDMLVLDLPQGQPLSTPLAVLGAENDQVFSVQEVQSTAKAYGVEAKIFPDMAHNMMSEAGWESVAEWISSWALSIEQGRG